MNDDANKAQSNPGDPLIGGAGEIVPTANVTQETTGQPVSARQGDAAARSRISKKVIGRQRELELILATVAMGRDVVLEGPPGTSKSTLLRAITSEWDIPLVFVEGNADLTPAKLVGHHNPSRVLQEDYSPDNFVDGPLIEAMRSGGFLFIEELNRAPEDTLNTLLTAMAEREIAVPRVGRVTARSTFRIIASMNPYDNVGTTRLSTSVHDRFCRLSVTYQDETTEREIVGLRTHALTGRTPPEIAASIRADAVALTRATRLHSEIRQGSSVRGAIDLALLADELVWTRDIGESVHSMDSNFDLDRGLYTEAIFDAMEVALSGRIHLEDTTYRTPESILREIWENHFVLNPAAAKPG